MATSLHLMQEVTVDQCKQLKRKGTEANCASIWEISSQFPYRYFVHLYHKPLWSSDTLVHNTRRSIHHQSQEENVTNGDRKKFHTAWLSRLHKPRLSAGRSTCRDWSIGGGRHTWASRPTTDWTAGGSLLRCRRYCTELTELSDQWGYRKCVGDILDYRCLLPTWSSSRGQTV